MLGLRHSQNLRDIQVDMKVGYPNNQEHKSIQLDRSLPDIDCLVHKVMVSTDFQQLTLKERDGFYFKYLLRMMWTHCTKV